MTYLVSPLPLLHSPKTCAHIIPTQFRSLKFAPTVLGMEKVMRLASERAVVIFTVSSCCMCHTVTNLLCGLGVNPDVRELDREPMGKEMERALIKLLGRNPPVPAIFIGGRLVGSTDRVMSLHLGGGLVPLLRNAGALWL